MSPIKLINQLEKLGKLDPKIIAKLREQVESSAEPPKATSILKFLVKKNLLSEDEARQVFKTLKSSPDEQVNRDIQETMVDPQQAEADAAAEAADLARVEESLSEVMEPGDLPIALAPVSEEPAYELMDEVPASRSVAPPNGESDGEEKEPESFRKWDTKDQWSSKWPFIGFGILVLLIMVGAFLAIWVGGVSADKQYDAAINSMKNLTFADAEEKFEAYLENNPNHKFADDARALRVQANMRNQFSSKRWNETIVAAQALLPELSEQEDNKLSKIRDDVGLMLSESLFHETETAVKLETLSEMEASLVKLKAQNEFIDNPLYISGTARKGQTIANYLAEIENNIQTVEGLINKEEDYSATTKSINELGSQSKTDEAFETYIRLTREYPDLAAREELRELMKGISKAEQELVLPLEQKTGVENGVPTSAVQASVVLASTTGEEVKGLRDEVIATLVDGAVYGFDAGTGEVKWRHFVGLQSTYQPESFDVDTVIVSDLLRNEVSRVKLDSGEVLWRALIGESFQRPTFNEQRVLVTTKSGRLILLDGANGEMVGGSKIPQDANCGGLIANRAPVFYQVGSYSNLYAMSSTDFRCKEVLYLGHQRNSISVAPVTWGGYIVVVRNGGDFADLLILSTDETGLNLKVNQIINHVTESQINTPILNFGRGLMLFGDGGDIRVLEVDARNEVSPVTLQAKAEHDTQNQPTFVANKGSDIWTAGKGIRRYKVQRSLGQFKNDENAEPGDSFLSAPTVIDDKIFHIRRRANSNMASASLADGKTLKPIWETNFGGAVAGVVPNGDGLTAVSNEGTIFNVTSGDISAGVAKRPIIASEVIESLKFDTLVPLSDDQFIVANSKGARDLLSYKEGDPKSRLFNMGLESNDEPEQSPLAMGNGLVVASRQGLISKLDTKNGSILGTPFLPPVSPGMTIPWQPLVPVTETIFAAAHAAVDNENGSTPSMLYFLSAESGDSVDKVAQLQFDSSIVSKIASDGQGVYGVHSDGAEDSLFMVEAGNAPSIAAEKKLSNRYVDGPWMAGELILLQLDDDSLTGFNKSFEKGWSVPIGNVQVASVLENASSGITVIFSNGKVLKLNSAQGTIEKEMELGQPVIGAPMMMGGKAVFSGPDGTIHFIEANQLE